MECQIKYIDINEHALNFVEDSKIQYPIGMILTTKCGIKNKHNISYSVINKFKVISEISKVLNGKWCLLPFANGKYFQIKDLTVSFWIFFKGYRLKVSYWGFGFKDLEFLVKKHNKQISWKWAREVREKGYRLKPINKQQIPHLIF